MEPKSEPTIVNISKQIKEKMHPQNDMEKKREDERNLQKPDVDSHVECRVACFGLAGGKGGLVLIQVWFKGAHSYFSTPCTRRVRRMFFHPKWRHGPPT